MDPRDLKDLFDNQKVTTRLTPSAVADSAERKMKVRRVGVVVAALALAVGGGIGATQVGSWLRSDVIHVNPAEASPSMTPASETPASETPSEPTPSATTQDPATPDPTPTDQPTKEDPPAPAFPEQKCSVKAPKGWLAMIDQVQFRRYYGGIGLREVDTRINFVFDGERITEARWKSPNGENLLISKTDDFSGEMQSDGRFVTYLKAVDSGDVRLFVWDSQNPENTMQIGDMDFGQPSDYGAYLSKGKLWVFSDDGAKATIWLADLATGPELRQVIEGKNLSIFPALNGKLQVTNKGKTSWLTPDGELTPLPAGTEGYFFDGESNGVYLLRTTAPNEVQTALWHDSWGKKFPLSAIEMVGDWVELDDGLFNYRTGVTIKQDHASQYWSLLNGHDGGYLEVHGNREDAAERKLIRLDELPEVGC